jgi:CRP-like cAMP-binding protein
MELEEARSIVNESLSEDLDPVALALVLSVAETRTASAGDLVLDKGEASEPCFYIVADGQVRAEDDDGYVLKSFRRPEIIGEIAVISPTHQRTCRVVADTDATLLAVNFDALMKLSPEKCDLIARKLEATAWARIAGYRD